MTRKLHYLSVLLAAFCFSALQTAQADVPPVTATTLDATTGHPATGTAWYTMTIGSSHKQISKQQVSASAIALSSASLTYGGESLWCFISNSDGTYTIYNAAGGVLASPKSITADNAASSNCLVLDVSDARLTGTSATYSSKWKFQENTAVTSTKTTPVALLEQGSGSSYGANEGSSLAFSTTSTASGSAVLIEPTDFKVLYCDATKNGSWTGTNGAGTYFSGWLSTATSPQAKLTTGTGKNDMYFVKTSNVDSLHLHTISFNVISATEGYALTAYGFNFRGYSGTSGTRAATTVTPATGASAVSCATTQESADLWVKGLSTSSTTFTVSSGAISPKDFYFVFKKEGAYCKHPFIPTTITDGNFAEDTHWYTLKVRGSKLATATAKDEDVDLKSSGSSSYAKDLPTQTDYQKWCFVGDSISGYKVYNKALGAGCALTALASPTDGSAPTMKDTASLGSSYTNVWWFSVSSNLSSNTTTPVYFKIGTDGYALNDYGGNGILKFWTGGKDVGSTFIIEPVWGEPDSISVNSTTGVFINNNTGTTGNWNQTWTEKYGLVTVKNASKNNMQALNSNGVTIAGNNEVNYTITCDKSYVITGYSMTVTTTSGDITVADGSGSGLSATNGQKLKVEGLTATSVPFTVTPNGSNTFSTTDFIITLKPASQIEAEEDIADNAKYRTTLVYDNTSTAAPYRIPALGMTGDGSHTLYVACDYRRTYADIGSGDGHNDVILKKSTDNGETWSEYTTPLASDQTLGTSSKAWNYSFGDPSIVVDRENPNNILIMAVAGHTGFFASTYREPQHVVRCKSTDGGTTWKVDSLTYQIYNLTTGGAEGTTAALFLTSGKIMQSRYVKAGSAYRLYIAYPTTGSARNANYVIYSDDFGDTWNLLGTKDEIPNSGADEAKIEELPDGSVMISARVRSTTARRFSIFHYTDVKNAKGFWDFEANATAMTGAVNAVNGGILVVPATRVSDNTPVYVALQSITLSTSREKVGVYYKELASYADYASADALAAGWTKGLQVSNTGSCYTTMQLLDNDKVGYCYEEEGGLSGGYNIVFKQISLKDLTNGAYSLNRAGADALRASFIAASNEALAEKTVTLKTVSGKYVGTLSADGFAAITSAENAAAGVVAKATESKTEATNFAAQEAVASLTDAIYNNEHVVTLTDRGWYRIRNVKTPAHTLTVSGTNIVCADSVYNSVDQLCQFQKQANGSYKLFFGNHNKYVGKTQYVNSAIPAVGVGSYTYTLDETNVTGESALKCTSPTDTSYPYLHSNNSTKVVSWTAGLSASPASYWYIEPVTEIQQALTVVPTDEQATYSTAYYPFAYTVENTVEEGDAEGVLHQAAYALTLSEDSTKASLAALEVVPAKTAVVLRNTAADETARGTVTLHILPTTTEKVVTAITGTLQPQKATKVQTSAKKVFVLNTNTDNEAIGLYPLAADVDSLSGNRAYLVLPAAFAGVTYIPFSSITPTVGIEKVVATEGDTRIYDLQGRRVLTPTKGGIYIVGGKKLIYK